MRFDWYQATVRNDPDFVIPVIQKLGNHYEKIDNEARSKHWANGLSVYRDGVVIAKAFWGGQNKVPHALASSDSTMELVNLLRNEFPEHYVTRFDSCEDFNETYDKLRRPCIKVAKAHGVAFPEHKDELNDEAGRTQYMGAPSSSIRFRLYEKGKQKWAEMNMAAFQQIYAMPDVFTHIHPETGEVLEGNIWTRAEVQVRPKGDSARLAASTATPLEAWGFTQWSHALALELFKREFERIHVREHKLTDDEIALSWMLKQYGKVLMRTSNKLGGWPELGSMLGTAIERMGK